jgi:hypothetical protein
MRTRMRPDPYSLECQMPTCQVLRCDSPAERLRVVNPQSPFSRVETLLCVRHDDEIEAGAPWFFDSHDRVYYVGEDLRAHGLQRLVDLLTTSLAGFSNFGRVLRLALTVAPVSSEGEQTEVTLLLSGEDVTRLAMVLAMYGGAGGGTPPDVPGG